MTEMQEKPIQKLLTPREYKLFLRFGIGPAERFKTDAERDAYRRVCDKVAAEQRRAARAERDFFIECAEAVDGLVAVEADAAERRSLRRKAKGFRQVAAEVVERAEKSIKRWRARVRRQMRKDC